MANSSSLENLFRRTASVPAPVGKCPLPEPGKGAPSVEHPDMMSILPQPVRFDYDGPPNKKEQKKFLKRLKQQAKSDPKIMKWAKENDYL